MRGETISEIEANNDTIFKGHAWIVDGYYKLRVITSEWSRIANLWGAEWELMNEYESYTPEYCHINWGFDGVCNGYFITGIFATNEAVEYDNTFNLMELDCKHNIRYFTVKR